MKDSPSNHSEKLPWYIQRWFWSILGAFIVAGVFLTIETLMPAYTINISWQEWVETKEFQFFIFIRALIGALVFGLLLYPKIKQNYTNKHGV